LEKGEDGRVYVWVNVAPDGDQNTVPPDPQVEVYRELIDELGDRVRSLEDANRENRRIIAALTQRIPELEAPGTSEPREAPVAASEGSISPRARSIGDCPSRVVAATSAPFATR
jgi:hypothetical protein